jgi:hypothetical protein
MAKRVSVILGAGLAALAAGCRPDAAPTVVVRSDDVNGVNLEAPDRSIFGLSINKRLGLVTDELALDDGDGILEDEDANRNGVLDPGEDLDGDGLLDDEDLDDNGQFNVVQSDLNGDGVIDGGDEVTATSLFLTASDSARLADLTLNGVMLADETRVNLVAIRLQLGDRAGGFEVGGVIRGDADPLGTLLSEGESFFVGLSVASTRGGELVVQTSTDNLGALAVDDIGDTFTGELNARQTLEFAGLAGFDVDLDGDGVNDAKAIDAGFSAELRGTPVNATSRSVSGLFPLLLFGLTPL